MCGALEHKITALLTLPVQWCGHFREVAVHTQSGIFGNAGTAKPFLAAAMTVAIEVHAETPRFLPVSMTLANSAHARVPASSRSTLGTC